MKIALSNAEQLGNRLQSLSSITSTAWAIPPRWFAFTLALARRSGGMSSSSQSTSLGTSEADLDDLFLRVNRPEVVLALGLGLGLGIGLDGLARNLGADQGMGASSSSESEMIIGPLRGALLLCSGCCCSSEFRAELIVTTTGADFIGVRLRGVGETARATRDGCWISRMVFRALSPSAKSKSLG